MDLKQRTSNRTGGS